MRIKLKQKLFFLFFTDTGHRGRVVGTNVSVFETPVTSTPPWIDNKNFLETGVWSLAQATRVTKEPNSTPQHVWKSRSPRNTSSLGKIQIVYIYRTGFLFDFTIIACARCSFHCNRFVNRTVNEKNPSITFATDVSDSGTPLKNVRINIFKNRFLQSSKQSGGHSLLYRF